MKIINGDITEIKSGYIIHQVNCLNAMSSGVAKALYLKYPQVKSEYHNFCGNKNSQELLGSVQYININSDLIIVNSFSQEFVIGIVEKPTDENLLIQNIRTVYEKAKKENKKVYIPYLIGCGLGNGNWNYILKNISDLDIIIVKLEK